MGFGVTSACQFGRSDQSKTSHETILGKFKMLCFILSRDRNNIALYLRSLYILLWMDTHCYMCPLVPHRTTSHPNDRSFHTPRVDQKPRAWTGCVAQRKAPAGPPPITATRALLLLRSILQSYKKNYPPKLTDNNKYRFRVKMQKYFPVRYDIIPRNLCK